MADQPRQPEVCTLTEERRQALQKESTAFNQLLRANEPGAKDEAAAVNATTEFYKFLPQKPTETGAGNEDRAFKASKAFYEQLASMPIPERQALYDYAMRENKEMHDRDPAMPKMTTQMQSDGWLPDMRIQYESGLSFGGGGLSMSGTCAKAWDSNHPLPPGVKSGWNLFGG